MVSSLPATPAIRASRLTLWLRRATVAILLAAVLLLTSVIGAGFYLSAPSPAVIGPPPPDLGAEAVTIASPSGSALKGWYIAGRAGGGAVVLLHGVNANRLAMLRRARLFKAEGFSVLLFDFQAPGERVGAVGSSLGGAAAVLGPKPLAVDALVLESVYSEIGTAIANRIRVVLGARVGGLVAQPMALLFEVVLPPFLGMRPAELRPIDHMATIATPLLVAA